MEYLKRWKKGFKTLEPGDMYQTGLINLKMLHCGSDVAALCIHQYVLSDQHRRINKWKIPFSLNVLETKTDNGISTEFVLEFKLFQSLTQRFSFLLQMYIGFKYHLLIS